MRTKVMILAAGLGRRLRPLTENLPKALVPLGKKPLLGWILDDLAASGIDEVVINLHYRGDMIRDYIAARGDQRPQPVFSDERKLLLGSGGGIATALDHFGGELFFVINCDSLFPWFLNLGVGVYGRIFSAMQVAYGKGDMFDAVLLSARQAAEHIGFPESGDYHLEASGQMIRPARDTDLPWAYCGVQLLHPRLLDSCPKGESFEIQPFWWQALDHGRMRGVCFDGVWWHIGTPEALDCAEKRFMAASEGGKVELE